MLQITISKRAAFIIATAMVLVIPGVAVGTHFFSDVDDASVHAPGIEWVAGVGVTVGCGDGSTYCPGDPVTRAQMGTFMHRLSGNVPGIAPSVNADTLDGLDSLALATMAVYAQGDQDDVITTVDEVMRSLSITPTADGVVIVNSVANVFEDTAGDDVKCSITTGTTLDSVFTQFWQSGGAGSGVFAQLAGARGFDVSDGETLTVNLVCLHAGVSGGSSILDTVLTAMFFPDRP